MLSNVKCIPATPMTFSNSVNWTDQFMLKAGCRYIYTKQSVAGMHPADGLDDFSQMKYGFHTCHSCVPMPQASRRNFHESCIYIDIVGHDQSTGHSWDGDCRTWKIWWYCHLLQLDTIDRIIDVLLNWWVSASHGQSKQSQYRAYLWKRSWLLDHGYYLLMIAEKFFYVLGLRWTMKIFPSMDFFIFYCLFVGY